MNLGSLNATGMGMQMNMNVNNSGQQPMQTNMNIVELQPTRSAPSSAGTGMLANNTMPKRPQRPSSTNIPNAMQKNPGQQVMNMNMGSMNKNTNNAGNTSSMTAGQSSGLDNTAVEIA